MDTILVFDGTKKLRKTKHTISMDLSNTPNDPSSVKLWVGTNSTVDGLGPNNLNDFSINMTSTANISFQASIDESLLKPISYLSFLFEVDGVTYLTNLYYQLKDFGVQQGFQTLLLNNVIVPTGSDYIFLKLPESMMGNIGKIYIYSISGDLVLVLHQGTVTDLLMKWDGRDRNGDFVAKGLYFIVMDFNDLKEIRKVFIK